MKKILSMILALVCLVAFQMPALAEESDVFLYCAALDGMEKTGEDDSDGMSYEEFMTDDGLFLVQVFGFETTEYGMVAEYTFEELLEMLADGDVKNEKKLNFSNVSFYPAERIRFESGGEEDSLVFDATAIWTEQTTFVFIAMTTADTWYGYMDGYGEGDAEKLMDEWVNGLEIRDAAEEQEIAEAYFEQKGFAINYEFGDGDVYMANGAHTYAYEGKSFAKLPAFVNLSVDSFNDTQDGYVEIEFTKILYVDSADYPDFMFRGKWGLGATNELYDYYTGYVLRGPAVLGNTERGENYRYFEYESQGRRICVDSNFSTEWIKHDDGSYSLVQEHFIRMPADYDGIIYAQLEGYDDYAAWLEGQEDSQDGIDIMDAEAAEDAVFCRINTID